MSKKYFSFIVTVITILFLTACGSAENQIIGSWKAVFDGETRQYIEINEERMINRSEESPSVEYILTETQSDTFLFEVVDPESGENFLMFEGYFEDRDTIQVVATVEGPVEDVDLQFIRVDDIAEDQAKEEAKKEEREARAAEEEEQERAEAEKRLEEEREKEKQQEEREMEERNKEEQRNEQKATEEVEEKTSSVQDDYFHRLDIIKEEIEARKVELGHDKDDLRLYGDYYGELDDLLNEVWSLLRDTMEEQEFDRLLEEQRAWLADTDDTFAEMSDYSAREREEAHGYLAYVRGERTYELVKNYLD